MQDASQVVHGSDAAFLAIMPETICCAALSHNKHVSKAPAGLHTHSLTVTSPLTELLLYANSCGPERLPSELTWLAAL